ncbi:NAD(P)H dehydrogenase (quinone) [Propionibacteriaceae bacterium ES.041]|uniref:NAD(P)H-dependent oxidoreductase n=1 Tax=Enemella evansiae TaxID=2016499 RepID=UPI000C01B786|nr:NAD(P)H-dependent oxidoreductase [Enemella evansiae]PFG65962.1 NAD(P)H dehydrogenase (quinone) [Propionibacteriaceae bacterium ES.041]
MLAPMTLSHQPRAHWVLAHPDPDSLNGLLHRAGVDALTAAGWQVECSDLYAMGWDPVLVTAGGADVRREQQKLCRADLLIVQFPLWWYGMPAILKGWFDRVFEAGYAYDVLDPRTGRSRKYGDGGLVGRRALTVVTAGDRAGSLAERGISGHIEDVLWPLLHGTFFYTGMAPLRPQLITDTRSITRERYAGLERALTRRLTGVLDEIPIGYRPMDDEHYDHSIALHPQLAPGATGTAAHRIDTRGELGTPQNG